MAKQVFPTKANLMATKSSLALAKLGYDLLDKKRNVLIKEMMSLLGEVKEVRDQITDSYAKAYRALEDANVSSGIISDLVENVPEDNGLHVKYRSVMGVELPRIDYEHTPIRVGYGFERANSKIDYAYICFSEVKELTVKLAEIENISIPQFEATVKMISEALEEKEREEFTRQKVIKGQKERAQSGEA